MPRPIRFIEPGSIVEVTTRTIHGRLLLRPSKELNELVVGILGKALAKPRFKHVKIHGFVFASNHYELILTPGDTITLAAFMGFVNSNIARKVGDLHGWKEKFWGRRYRDIAILDDSSLVHRMRYMLSHGCKEGLVERPRNWPGASCLPALVSGRKIQGVWIDRTAEYRARQRGERPGEDEFATVYEVPIEPIPCWQDLPAEERCQKYREMVAEIEWETRARNHDNRRFPPGPRWVCKQHPHSIPRNVSRSPAPRCHASSREQRRDFCRAYAEFVAVYRYAVQQMRSGYAEVEFPLNCFPPPRPPRTYPLPMPP